MEVLDGDGGKGGVVCNKGDILEITVIGA
jgi:hypothetical protein